MRFFLPFAAIFMLHFNLSFVNATPKDSLSVVLYETSQKFIKGDSVYVDAIAIGQLENQDLIIVKKILNKNNGKKVKDAKLIWALKYKGKIYVNLGYCDDINLNSYFIRLEVIGNYCVSALHPQVFAPPSANNIIMSSIGGAVGVLAGSYSTIVWKNKSQWKDSYTGVQCPVLFLDLTEKGYNDYSQYRNESSRLYLITKKELSKLLKKHGIFETNEIISTTDVKNCINSINKSLKIDSN
jgi:hypothetical protein